MSSIYVAVDAFDAEKTRRNGERFSRHIEAGQQVAIDSRGSWVVTDYPEMWCLRQLARAAEEWFEVREGWRSITAAMSTQRGETLRRGDPRIEFAPAFSLRKLPPAERPGAKRPVRRRLKVRG